MATTQTALQKKTKTTRISKKATKTGASNGWTEGRFNSFIRSLIRSGFRRYPAKYEVLKAALWGKKLNPKTGRQCIHYTCASCNKEYPAKEVNVDHIEPVVCPVNGFENWDVYIKRMFCPKENLQVLCSTCHTAKTDDERKQRGNKE